MVNPSDSASRVMEGAGSSAKAGDLVASTTDQWQCFKKPSVGIACFIPRLGKQIGIPPLQTHQSQVMAKPSKGLCAEALC